MNRRQKKDYKIFSLRGHVYRAWLIHGELHVLCTRKNASHAWQPLPRLIAQVIWKDYLAEKASYDYDQLDLQRI